jgi:chromate transporter
MKDNPFLALLLVFAPLSLAAIGGGGSSTLAGLQHQAIDVHHWLNAGEFLEAFAISRAAPGPGSLLSTLIGLKVAGILGAVVATLAMFLPSALLAFSVVKVWDRFRGRRWHTALQEGLAPVGGGLMFAAVLTIGRLASNGLLSWAVAAAAALVIWLRPNFHPLIAIATGAVVFALYGLLTA